MHPTRRSVSVGIFGLGLSLGLAFGATATPVPAGYEGLPSVDPDGTPLFRPDGTSNASLLPWEDYAAHIQKRSGIAALGPDLFGDRVNLYSGALSFSVTDVELPGNSALRVALTRTLSVSAKPNFYLFDRPLADWDLELPNISGTYGWVANGERQWPSNRCSNLAGPPNWVSGSSVYGQSEYWQGLHANIPGGGELLVADTGAPRPTGASYVWVTPGFVYLRCLPGIRNGTGEGFEAITPDGIKYRFDWMAQYYEAPLEAPISAGSNVTALPRRVNVLYATRVEDRHGNSVDYLYTNAADQPARLTEIRANDGRLITLTYYAATGLLETVSANGRTWTYHYNDPKLPPNPQRPSSLIRVGLPDGKQWTLDLKPISDGRMDFLRGPGENRHCGSINAIDSNFNGGVGIVTHPSGAVGTFEVRHQRLGRSNVPKVCNPQEVPVDLRNDTSFFVRDSDVLALKRKTIAGPSIPVHEWSWEYGATRSFVPTDDEGSGDYCGRIPGEDRPNCADPVCLSGSCAGTLVVRINAPDGEWQRYTFGNSYRYNEGKLRRIERGNSETEVLETEEIEYELAQSGLPYSAAVGTSLRTRGDGFADAYVRPRIQSVISRQGATFSWQATTFDAFARVTAETHTSSLGHTRSITQTFEDLLDPWIVGLPRVRSVNGLAERDLRYNAAALVEHEYRFGERRVSFGYRPDGTIQTVTDGRNFVTEANDWKRGLPQEVVYPSATGVRRATVDDNGWVRTITDETVEANVRTYDYDPLGRITDIDYPAGWAPTDRDFAPLQSDEYGIPAGSWKQTIATGNYRKHVWFDALWRPILEREWDATDPAGTQRFVRRGYDLRFNENFVSFAASSIGTITDLSAGTTTQFDRLNRRTTVSTPSELGVLTTSYAYETGFETRVTNARGYTQLIRYQAFDRPTEDYPTYVGSGLNGVPAEQSFTTITRDAWGKVLTMRRTGNGADATRSYLYDARQRLCQLTEPESGALVMDYDAAGNLWWSAEGRAPAATCDAARAVPPASRIIRVWHPRNWLSQIDYPEVSGLPSADTYYEYWPDGAVKQVSTEGSTRRYEYNTVRALDLETVEIGQGLDRPGVSQLTSVRSFVFDWQHDAQGAVSGLVYPGANGGAAYTTNFAPNALGQPTQVGSLVSGAVWHPDGQSAGWVYGNGITRTQTVNDRRLPLQVRETTAGGAVVFDETQLYDANANVMNVIDARDSAYNRLLDYDAQDRLRSASGVWGAGTFSFDGADNLLTQTIGAKSYSYAYSSQKLTAITGAGGTSIAFAHDGRGNVLQKGTAQYVWDVANRLVRTGDQLYRYDGHGRRTVAATVDALGQPVGASTLTIYSRDGQLLYEERIGANVPAGQIFANGFEPGAAAGESVTLTYHWLGKALVARRETRGAQVGTVWLTTDVLGSVVAETGPTAAVLNRTHYQPFGIPNQPRTGPGYTGHVMDIGTGLVYMQGRYYDADVGRFLSMDPVAPSAVDGADFNRYAYARNNPYRYTDPDGHAIETGWDIANIAIGVVSFGTNVAAGNWGAAAVDAAGVVVDAVATAVPGMPGGAGSVIKAARAADAAVEAGQAGRVADVGADAGSAAASPLARGRESEARVLADMGLSKNGQSVSTDEGLSIPDGLTEVRSVEIKDAQRVPLTKQLRIQTDAARESGRTSTLVTGESTCVSGPCAEAFDEVIRRPDLGPRNK